MDRFNGKLFKTIGEVIFWALLVGSTAFGSAVLLGFFVPTAFGKLWAGRILGGIAVSAFFYLTYKASERK